MTEPIHIISLGAGVQSSTMALFLSRIIKTNRCWLWPNESQRGRGTFRIDGRKLMAHQASWILHFGEIPEGLNILHHCDNPSCVRPDHLFLGTQQDNIDDMCAKGRHSDHKHWDGKTHCQNGHLLVLENIYNRVRNGQLRRECRKCRNEATYRYANRNQG